MTTERESTSPASINSDQCRSRIEQHEVKAKYRELKAIAEKSAAQLADLPPFSEADLYDQDGLPR